MQENRNKKVGIITFHFAHNYGAMLQAYAMQEQLLSMGYDASIIDYEPFYHKRFYEREHFKDCIEISPVKTIRHMIGYMLRFPLGANRYNNFESFKLNRMRLYPYNPDSDFSEFDYILLGSDQIWNQALTNNCFDGPYFGEGFRSKVFSYAASSKYKALSGDLKEQFRIKLRHLFAIGVRESSFKELLQPLTDKPISVNLDPSLIIEKDSLSALELSPPIKTKYVVIYEVNPHKEVILMAKNYARKHGARVVSLVAYLEWRRRFQHCDQVASPEKFLAYIKNAACVFTTSFHGTAFSILFNTPFFAVRQNTNDDLRIESLLLQLGIEDHFVSLDARPTDNKIVFSDVNSRLQALKSSSLDYLKACLTA